MYHLNTVKFLHFQQDIQGKESGELGLRWIILALYDTADLQAAFT